MNTIPLTQDSQTEVVKTLAAGGLVIAPSDTVYGMLVDAANPRAVEKLLAFKNRPIGKPISVFVSGVDAVGDVAEVSTDTSALMTRFLPGPFTVILPGRHTVDRRLESEKGTLGVRVPDYEYITSLVAAFGRPVTATSANISGRSPHYSLESFTADLSDAKKDLIDLMVDGGKLPRHKPSTVVDLTTPEVRIVRKGDILWTDEKTYVSESPAQTRAVAAHLLTRLLPAVAVKPQVVIMEGDLGAGKTEFMRGIGERLGIDRIISPTYVIYYEYDAAGPVRKLYHFDLYQIEAEEEFDHLGIPTMLKPGSLLCFEWGEKSAAIMPMLKEQADVTQVKIEYDGKTGRTITIQR